MDTEELLQIIESNKKFPLNEEQKKVVNHTNDPLWVIAGPGSGKTEVLVIRTLKLIFVDKIDPKSIIITTFTEKAAQNLLDRIVDYSSYIFDEYPHLTQQFDIQSIHIGTLHSICNDIMLEYRYEDYENYRLLDDMEQYLFIYEHSELVRDTDAVRKYWDLWEHYEYLVNGYDPVTGYSGWSKNKIPNAWKRTNAAIKLFDRIVEDILDLDEMKNSGSVYELLLESYNDYIAKLESNGKCDFAHLQKKFLEFLDTPKGQSFLNDDNRGPQIQYIMVDEYQDTNPIQEAIYFKLAGNTHNLCVVGDDDQALYRFRGGTVECMVRFDQSCYEKFGITLDEGNKSFLSINYRSHEKIVNYYDNYINSFESMQLEGARVSEKPKLISDSPISGEYPAVAFVTDRTIPLTAKKFASTVKGLLDNNIIKDPSQCVLLMKSVKENVSNAKHFADALRDVKITPYNPRSRTFLEQEEIMVALGAFISIVDPELSALKSVGPDKIKNMVKNWVSEYERISTIYGELSEYVERSKSAIRAKPKNDYLNVNILEIFYRIVAHEPFSTWNLDKDQSIRLGKLSTIFESYSSIPYLNYQGSNRGNLKTSEYYEGEVSYGWRRKFYYALAGILASKGLNDPEDEEVICPPNYFPIMTVHQAKGLEFDFVFVYGLAPSIKISSSILLEDDLSFLKMSPSLTTLNSEYRAEQDSIRFFFVAYSRAKYALIHIVPKSHFKNGRTGFINKKTREFRKYAEDV